VLEGVGRNLHIAAPSMDTLNQIESAIFSSLVFLGAFFGDSVFLFVVGFFQKQSMKLANLEYTVMLFYS
jgi:hypothetical protein